MLARGPAASLEIAFSDRDWFVLERRRHGVVPAVEKTEQRYDPDDLDEKTSGKYCHQDPDGRVYRLSDLTNPNPDRPNLTYEFLGIRKVWRWTKDRMQAAYAHAIAHDYRFYSYGDASLLLP